MSSSSSSSSSSSYSLYLLLLKKSSLLLKRLSDEKLQSFDEIKSKLLPILANIILICTENINEMDICNNNIQYLNELIQCIILILTKWTTKENNYFHTYREEVLISEITSVIIYMDIVHNILESGISVDPFIQISRKFLSHNESNINNIPTTTMENVLESNNNNNHNNNNIDDVVENNNCSNNDNTNVSDINLVISEIENNINNENISIDIINDFLSKLFWVGYFGSNCYSIKWDLFSTAFMSSYGYQNLHAMRKLKENLCLNDSESNIIDSDNVSILTYATFCNNSDGLLHAFQKACDTGTLIMYSGNFDAAVLNNNNNNKNNENKRVEVLKVLDCLIGIQVKQISCGGQHCAIVTNDGKCYTWGKGSYGRLGHGSLAAVGAPTEVLSLSDKFMIKVTCGFAFTSVISNDGELYSWGANENGRLGLGDTVDKMSPQRVLGNLKDHNIIDICAGSVHSCVLTSKGLVFSYGKLEYTGHGLNETSDILLPLLLDHFDGIPIIQISSGFGGYHTLALTERGVVFAWGHNRVSQTGIQNSSSAFRNAEGAFYVPKPTPISGFSEKIKTTSAGWGHSVIITESGIAYSVGRNTDGQLGLGDLTLSSLKINERGHCYQPYFRKITALENLNVVDVTSGAEHSIFTIKENNSNCSYSIYSCGSNVHGQLAVSKVINDENSHFYIPQYSNELKKIGRHINQIECGGEITFFLFGNYNPLSLKEICTNIINEDPSLQQQLNQSMDINEL